MTARTTLEIAATDDKEQRAKTLYLLLQTWRPIPLITSLIEALRTHAVREKTRGYADDRDGAYSAYVSGRFDKAADALSSILGIIDE